MNHGLRPKQKFLHSDLTPRIDCFSLNSHFVDTVYEIPGESHLFRRNFRLVCFDPMVRRRSGCGGIEILLQIKPIHLEVKR
jgi:hypothetical protein